MTSSERPSPEPLLKKEASPTVLRGENSWECFGGFKCLEFLGFGEKSSESVSGSSRNFSGISSGKSQRYWEYGPSELLV